MPAYVLEADEDEEPEIRGRIERSLRHGSDWTVTRVETRAIAEDEHELADRLAGGPRRSR